ncbi:VWA domain-containing protein [Paracoccaceae bacterium]|nr:VWA domain-containing protein [Paracoccaceae bacterium]
MANKIDFLEHELDANALIQGILTISSIDPSLGSLSIKANYSTVREVFLSNLLFLLKPKRLKKIYPFQNPTDFNKNINMFDTLTLGMPKYNEDIFSSDNIALILTNTEKMEKGLASFLRDKIKNNSNKFFIALDESESNEVPRANLSDYLIFSINLDGTRHRDLKKVSINRKKIAEARENLATVEVNKKILNYLIASSEMFSISDMYTIFSTLKVAKSLCAYKGENSVSREDINLAISLSMIHKAKQIPEFQQAEKVEAPKQEQSRDDNESKTNNAELNNEDKKMLIDSLKISLPGNLIESLLSKNFQSIHLGESTGSGEKNNNFSAGRPIPPVNRKYSSDKRIDLMATLTKAIPWQKLRSSSITRNRKIIIYPQDIMIRRFEKQSERLLIFVVDASGSNAIGRLAEAKGAVEILLSEAYAKRDNVALIAFSGLKADALLLPTKSLVTAKKKLSSLPGGGATPLATGLLEAFNMADAARSRNIKPIIILLSDGRGNMSLDGVGDRAKAIKDTNYVASLIKRNAVNNIFIDTSRRKTPMADELARELNGHYFQLPMANSGSISKAVQQSI